MALDGQYGSGQYTVEGASPLPERIPAENFGDKVVPLPTGACFDWADIVPAGAEGPLEGETIFDWSKRTGTLPLVGPGDLSEIIDEPDYKESLRKSAEIFGGTPEDYRSPGMTQEAWEALGTQGAPIPPQALLDPASYPLMRQPQDAGPLAKSNFFENVFAPLDPCCRETLATATENLAVLSASLFRKSEAAMDEALAMARVDAKNADLVLQVAHGYLNLAKETA